jgi:hypothetical protein
VYFQEGGRNRNVECSEQDGQCGLFRQGTISQQRCKDTLHLTPMFGAPKESSFLGGAEQNGRPYILARLDLDLVWVESW